MGKILNYMYKQKLNFYFNRKYQLKVIEKKILSYIGLIILKKHNMSYEETYKLLKIIGIHSISCKNNQVHLYMNRPGIFIGKHGELIEYIGKELKKVLNNNKLKICVHEYGLELYLFPVDYKDCNDF